jgi:transmembrane sensor
MPYTQFSVSDFVTDPFFNRWVRHTDEKAQAFWSNWLVEHPEKIRELEEAKKIILALREETPAFNQEELDQMWHIIDQRTQDQTPRKTVFPSQKWWSDWRKVAASLSLVLLGSMARYFYQQQYGLVYFQTGYGESKLVQLEDGSVVKLNANSSFHTRKHWPADQARLVWLEGEAFFQVIHTHNHQPFQVITDEVTVEALGTAFNVWQRGKKAKVVLQTGKVEVSRTNQADMIIMKPGELVEVEHQSLKLRPHKVNTDRYLAWKEGKLIFEEIPLREIADLLRDNYGLVVEVQDSTLLAKEITTQVNDGDVDLLIKLLGETLQVHVQRKGNHILFQPSE